MQKNPQLYDFPLRIFLKAQCLCNGYERALALTNAIAKLPYLGAWKDGELVHGVMPMDFCDPSGKRSNQFQPSPVKQTHGHDQNKQKTNKKQTILTPEQEGKTRYKKKTQFPLGCERAAENGRVSYGS